MASTASATGRSRRPIEARILLIRGQKVMLDSDPASLYGVSTKRLNEQAKRNRHRFPLDFMFQLSEEETENLRSQVTTSSGDHGGRRLASSHLAVPAIKRWQKMES